jgi:hypothetical protein
MRRSIARSGSQTVIDAGHRLAKAALTDVALGDRDAAERRNRAIETALATYYKAVLEAKL